MIHNSRKLVLLVVDDPTQIHKHRHEDENLKLEKSLIDLSVKKFQPIFTVNTVTHHIFHRRLTIMKHRYL